MFPTPVHYQNCLAELSYAIPEFQDLTYEHPDWLDPVLSYPLFSLFASPYIESRIESGEEPEVLARCLDFLERLVSSDDPQVRAMVVYCFIDDLGPDCLLKARDRLGPRTRDFVETFQQTSKGPRKQTYGHN